MCIRDRSNTQDEKRSRQRGEMSGVVKGLRTTSETYSARQTDVAGDSLQMMDNLTEILYKIEISQCPKKLGLTFNIIFYLLIKTDGIYRFQQMINP